MWALGRGSLRGARRCRAGLWLVQRTFHKDPPLVRLQDAHIPGLGSVVGRTAPGLAWTIGDGGAHECWAVVGPSADKGGAVRQALRDVLLGNRRPRIAPEGSRPHPPVHAFPREAIAHVSFEVRHGHAGGGFVDYATRYGSIRENDRETLYEHLLASRGVYTGGIARRHMQPDVLAPAGSDAAEGVGTLKWPSREAREAATAHARAVCEALVQLAPLLGIDEALLQRPMIALSNGQARRARILQALLGGAQWLVLDEPYTGMDAPTREDVSALFARLHAARQPRLCLFLREQDAVPAFVTHILRIDEDGRITQLGDHVAPAPAPRAQYAPGGYDVVRANAAAGVGVGTTAEPVAELHGVSVTYGDVRVLSDVSLTLRPGQRLVLVGDNGSGKTTLLSLLLGDHPRAYAMPADTLQLWGAERSAPHNAHVLLQRRVGHVSPELFNAFPRKALESGGLTVADAVESGFEGIFTQRRRAPAEAARARVLLGAFADVLVQAEPVASGRGDAAFASVDALANAPFASLSHGSQALVLLLRAVVHRPRLLVLDEPFQGMSAAQAARARAFLDGDAQAPGVSDADEQAWRAQLALVLVSHYESEWLRTCGSLVRLSRGVVTEQW